MRISFRRWPCGILGLIFLLGLLLSSCLIPGCSEPGACQQDTDCSGTMLCQNGVCVNPETDGGKDAGADAGTDAGHDAGGDPGADPGSDSGSDPGADPGADQIRDAGFDGGTDAGSDLGSDPGADPGSDPGPGPDENCQPVQATPSPDPWGVRSPSAGFGGIFTQQSGSFTDVFLKSPTDYIRIGTRLDWGGTVVYFGLSSGGNVIDANDTGREVQVAIYDQARAWQGCAYNASCQSLSQPPCGSSITFLGWNPVQGGDECNRGAAVLSYGQAGDALQLIIQPNQWNPEWDAPDCRNDTCDQTPAVPVGVQYRFELRFVREHVVEVMTEVQNTEDLDHPEAWQEFPCLYVANGAAGLDLTLLLDSSLGTVTIPPASGQASCVGFSSPGGWVTWQPADQTYGVGLASDQGITDFFGCDGDGTTYPYFHYTRYNSHFPVGPRALVRGIAYLALGNTGTVESELREALRVRPPFGVVDIPAAGQDQPYVPGDAVRVAGWVLDTQHVDTVTVEVDGQPFQQIPVTASRPDVCLVYPNYSGCPAVGYDGSFPTAGFSHCPHLLRVTATDLDDNRTVLGERVIVPSP